MFITGIALGLLIGILSGVVALVLLKTANTASMKDVSSLVALTSEILAIPTFWFGPALANYLKWVPWEEIKVWYLPSLFVSFTVVVCFPLFRWIVSLGEKLGRDNEERNA